MPNQSAYFESPVTERLPAAFNCSGIYGIRHTASSRIYVGSAKDIRTRLYQHLGALLAKKHHSRYLQNAWNKYGQSAFNLILLEKGVVEKLIETEQFWIDHYDSYEKGFNARPKAESMRGVKWSKAQNEARSQSNRKSWSDEALRQKLSARFKGQRRGMWTANSHKKISHTLKQRHAENPEWRKTIREWMLSPKNEAKRIEACKAALKRPEIYKARVQQLRMASKSPAKDVAVRKAYFEKFNRKTLGFQNPEEMDQACLKLHLEGKSCREIGWSFQMSHHSVSSRLRRLGITLKLGRQYAKHT